MLTREQLAEYINRQHLTISDYEIDAIISDIDYAVRALSIDKLSELDGPSVKPYGGERDSGRRPIVGEDPYNAIIHFCNIAGAPTGPLTGMRIGVKDNIAVAGVPITKGKIKSPVAIPVEDAVVVERMLRAGANITAKTNLELGGSDYGRTINPINPRFSCGASSSGSAAAVAAGIVDSALGTDAGGSIRHPASYCGIVGMKPTYGLVPSYGKPLDCQRLTQIGPMTTTVADNATILEVIAGKDWRDPESMRPQPVPGSYTAAAKLGVSGIRLGVVAESLEQASCSPETIELFERAQKELTRLGAEIKLVSVPLWKHSTAIWSPIYIYGQGAVPARFTHDFSNGRVDIVLQKVMGLQYWLENPRPATEQLTSLLYEHICREYLGKPLGHAQNLRLELVKQIDNQFEKVDALIAPMCPSGPIAISQLEDSQNRERRENKQTFRESATIANLTGHPALTVPSMPDENGIPTGIQIIGRKFDEHTVYRIGFACEF